MAVGKSSLTRIANLAGADKKTEVNSEKVSATEKEKALVTRASTEIAATTTVITVPTKSVKTESKKPKAVKPKPKQPKTATVFKIGDDLPEYLL